MPIVRQQLFCETSTVLHGQCLEQGSWHRTLLGSSGICTRKRSNSPPHARHCNQQSTLERFLSGWNVFTKKNPKPEPGCITNQTKQTWHQQNTHRQKRGKGKAALGKVSKSVVAHARVGRTLPGANESKRKEKKKSAIMPNSSSSISDNSDTVAKFVELSDLLPTHYGECPFIDGHEDKQISIAEVAFLVDALKEGSRASQRYLPLKMQVLFPQTVLALWGSGGT